MNPLLLWLVPPLVGAGIGYFTNAVAIKMLFRPLNKIRLFGIPLPFTPGILPRERHKLAENIGRMVERELLTEEVLSAHLSREEVRERLRRSVADHTGQLLAASPLVLFTACGAGDQAPRLPGFLRELFRDILRGTGGELLFGSFGDALGECLQSQGALDTSFRELVGEETGRKLEKAFREGLEAFLERSAGEEDFWERFFQAAEGFYPRVVERFLSFLGRDEIRRELEIQGQIFLSRVFLKMNVFQRFFLSAGQYDRTLQDRMPEIIDDLIRQTGDFLPGPQVRSRLLRQLAAALRQGLTQGETRRRLSGFITGRLSLLASQPLGSLIPADLLERGGEPIRRFFLRFAVPAEAGTAEPGLFSRFLEKLRERLAAAEKAGEAPNLGRLLSLEGLRKEELDALITEKILTLAKAGVGTALKSINVQALVSGRIDSLDMIRVERIVLDVMAHQLKWINLFGAILGALIGVCQSVLAWFTR
jgi:hypothetical protein